MKLQIKGSVSLCLCRSQPRVLNNRWHLSPKAPPPGAHPHESNPGGQVRWKNLALGSASQHREDMLSYLQPLAISGSAGSEAKDRLAEPLDEFPIQGEGWLPRKGGLEMRLSPPKQVIWFLAVIVGLAAILLHTDVIAFRLLPEALDFWLMTAAFGLLVLGTLFRGL